MLVYISSNIHLLSNVIFSYLFSEYIYKIYWKDSACTPLYGALAYHSTSIKWQQDRVEENFLLFYHDIKLLRVLSLHFYGIHILRTKISIDWMKMDTTNGKPVSNGKNKNLFWVDNSIKKKIIYKRMRKVRIIRRIE